jgi:hypothetical protein
VRVSMRKMRSSARLSRKTSEESLYLFHSKEE